MSAYTHVTVLLNEAVDNLLVDLSGVYVDCTFGRGGHSSLILRKLDENGRLIALDCDLSAIATAKKISDKRFEVFHQSFVNLKQLLAKLDLVGKVDGILLDLGVSSPQIDDPNRGFSFMQDGPLDMRMDNSAGLSAKEWLSLASVEDIAFVLKTFGEERFAKKIAQVIVDFNKNAKLNGSEILATTSQLASLIEKTIPFRDKHKHPATRSFQAIRIYINSELMQLEQVLNDSLEILAKNGRLAIISFHSLEDRMVKQFMKKHSSDPELPRGLPLLDSQIKSTKTMKLETKAIKPTDDEIKVNPRSRSAILRVCSKI